MLILPALFTLLTYLFWRPHQIFDIFQPLTVNAAFALVGFAYVLDVRAGAERPRGSPLLALGAAFAFWCLVTMAVRAPERMAEEIPKLATWFLVLFFVSEGVQTLRGLAAAGTVLVVFTVALALLGVEQGLSPTMCYLRDDSALAEDVAYGFDGRSCTSRPQCYETGLAGGEYGCEHPGWLGTSSVGGRVRYRGILEDPNELAWTLSMGIPFAFALYESKRSRLRLAFLVAGVVLTAACVIMTQSLSGQLSLMANLGVYFVRRYRGRGLVAAALAAVPLLLLGGRSGADAESSSDERLGCWSEALSMWRENPVLGVGSGQFTEHHFQTAHNSFLLTLAELGPLGFLLWTSVVYFAVKLTIAVQVQLRGRPEAAAARTWSMALLASMVGLIVSAVFLSLSYHPILWLYLGMAGALYAAVRQHDPDFRVRFGIRDLGLVAAFDVAFVTAVAFYLRLKGV